jgi:hypothetical protein
MDTFVALRCPNRINPNKSKSCGFLLGGIGTDALSSYDFSLPFEDIRICRYCGAMVKTTITSLDKIPEMVVFPKSVTKEQSIRFVPIRALFSLVRILIPKG